MEKPIQFPNFNEVAQALETLESFGEASETHGLLTAFLAHNIQFNRQSWINSMITEKITKTNKKKSAAVDILTSLFDATANFFSEDAFELTLLLPNDDASFELRIEALAHWCQGYLTGLNLLGIDIEHQKDEDIAEALQDLINVSCLQYNGEITGDEESEQAYMQLVEYAKVAVMMVKNL